MEWLKILFSFLKEILPTATTFLVGRKSKELQNIKEENQKLKQYKKIDEAEPTKKEVYTSSEWV